jgi:hypothetical protein
MRTGAELEERQRWMRERNTSATVPPLASLFAERHYTIKEIALMWNLSPHAVRRIFQNEPGVLVLGDQSNPRRRRYTTLRIPESVLDRVHRRMCSRITTCSRHIEGM